MTSTARRFGVNLIPHTLEVTTLGDYRAGHARQPGSRYHRALSGTDSTPETREPIR